MTRNHHTCQPPIFHGGWGRARVPSDPERPRRGRGRVLGLPKPRFSPIFEPVNSHFGLLATGVTGVPARASTARAGARPSHTWAAATLACNRVTGLPLCWARRASESRKDQINDRNNRGHCGRIPVSISHDRRVMKMSPEDVKSLNQFLWGPGGQPPTDAIRAFPRSTCQQPDFTRDSKNGE